MDLISYDFSWKISNLLLFYIIRYFCCIKTIFYYVLCWKIQLVYLILNFLGTETVFIFVLNSNILKIIFQNVWDSNVGSTYIIYSYELEHNAVYYTIYECSRIVYIYYYALIARHKINNFFLHIFYIVTYLLCFIATSFIEFDKHCNLFDSVIFDKYFITLD